MSGSKPRDKFERILQNLILCDNKQLDKQDKFLKLHPMINELNKSFLKFSFSEEKKFIDESMIPY